MRSNLNPQPYVEDLVTLNSTIGGLGMPPRPPGLGGMPGNAPRSRKKEWLHWIWKPGLGVYEAIAKNQERSSELSDSALACAPRNKEPNEGLSAYQQAWKAAGALGVLAAKKNTLLAPSPRVFLWLSIAWPNFGTKQSIQKGRDGRTTAQSQNKWSAFTLRSMDPRENDSDPKAEV